MVTPASIGTDPARVGLAAELAGLDPIREADFEQHRQALYPTAGLNLNPGMLGTPASPVLEALRTGSPSMLPEFPLSQYMGGREALEAARTWAGTCWPGLSLPAFPGGTTQSMNLITHALPLTFQRLGHTGKLRVLTSQHEHEGALGGFLHHPGYEVHFFPDEVFQEPSLLAEWLERVNPQVLLLSQVTYTEARRLPVEVLFEQARAFPKTWRVLDAAQSVGWEQPAAEYADLTVASAHKWLGGPYGTGFLWLSPRALEQLTPFSWLAGEEGRSSRAAFEPAGGQAFTQWEALRVTLELHSALQEKELVRRSALLCKLFLLGLEEGLEAPLESHVQLLGADLRRHEAPPMPMFSLELRQDSHPIYLQLNREGIFVKCIKTVLPLGKRLNVLRVGMLWYQSAVAAASAGQRLGELLRDGA